jgi:hypothetical protein
MVNKIEQRGQATVFISYAREDKGLNNPPTSVGGISRINLRP